MSGRKTQSSKVLEKPAEIREPRAETLASAADALRNDQLVAVPTETVYGLGANAASDIAVARLFAAKGRPRFNPLIAHVADINTAEKLAEFSDEARAIARAFWPGPLTLILKRRQPSTISELATAGLDTIAVRVPAHPIMQQLLAQFGGAIVAPSANRSGRVSATTAADVAADFSSSQVFAVLDGGPCQLGIESTIVDASGDLLRILRPGAIARETLAQIAPIAAANALPIADDQSDGQSPTPTAPGQLRSHYAPRAKLRLHAERPMPDEAFLAFGAAPDVGDVPVVNLSPSGDLVEAAARLFSSLRALDATGVASIAVMPIPEHGLGEAINDRLARAAAPRPETRDD